MPKVLQQTKHFQVTRQLRRDINALDAHEYVPTAAELVSRYETSHATIIRALTHLRRDGVIYRPAGQKRYQVAEFTAKPLARIAIVRPQYPSAGLDGNIRKIVEAGHRMQLAFDFKHYENMKVLDLNRVSEDEDAIILMPTTEPIPPHIQKAMVKPNKPIVLMTHHLDLSSICSVTVADEEVGQMAVQHAQQLGHTRCLILLDQTVDTTIQGRLDGWRKQMLTQITHDEVDRLILDAQIKPFDDAREMSYQAMHRILTDPDKPKFTAVFSTSDSGAQGISRACFELGIRIPDDLSVISYTGANKIGQYSIPPMTTVESDMDSLGELYCKLILTQLKNQEPQVRHYQLSPTLHVRQSTAPLSQ
jgi:DNA-binding LacI/PurR family transcriptional regulator/DNA-binding transcriptional regulator YhcF (GntR family)